MIAWLEGKVGEVNADQIVIVAAGVGYGVMTNHEVLGKFKTGDQIKLNIHENITEKSHDLYGFESNNSRDLFEMLISVNGVGPKMGLAIMNLGGADELKSAIARGDSTYVMRASGVGKRLAERIVVDLKDKFAEHALRGYGGGEVTDDALDALTTLGYSKNQAAEALSKIDGGTTEEKIKQALKILS